MKKFTIDSLVSALSPVICVTLVLALVSYTQATYVMPEIEVAEGSSLDLSMLETVELDEEGKDKGRTDEIDMSGLVDDGGNWADGVYQGTAYGYKSNITVEVTIEGGVIVSIRIVSEAEDAEYFNKAVAVINYVLAAQSVAVDTVSGATYSSVGILTAIQNALAKASGASEEETTSSKKSTTKADSSIAALLAAAADGRYTYTVTTSPDSAAEFTAYSIDFTFVVSGGAIIAVEYAFATAKDEAKNADYVDKALDGYVMGTTEIAGLNEAICAAPKAADLDTVSGATCTSKALKAAYKLFLADLKAGNLAAAVEGTDSESDEEDGLVASAPSTSATVAALLAAAADGDYVYTVVTYADLDEDFDDYVIDFTFTLSGGAIVAIDYDFATVADEDKNWSYVEQAIDGWTSRSGTVYAGMVERLSAGPDAADVDTVSGATCTSNAILTAYAALLADLEAGTAEPVGGSSSSDEAVEPGAGEESNEGSGSESGSGDEGSSGDTGSGDTGSDTGSGDDQTGGDSGSGDEATEPTEPETPGDSDTGTGDEDEGDSGSEEPGTGDEDEDADDKDVDTVSGAAASIAKLADGTYSITVVTYPDADEDFDAYYITYYFTVADGKITSVTYAFATQADEEENDYYADMALNGYTRRKVDYPGIADNILAADEVADIDTISGATCSSVAILQAYAALLDYAEGSTSSGIQLASISALQAAKLDENDTVLAVVFEPAE